MAEAADGAPEELDNEWLVGGKYEAASTLGLHGSVDCTGEYVSRVRPQEVVLLLQMQTTSSGLAGLVVPPAPHMPGWVRLEDPSAPASGASPIVRRHLPSSWKMKSRYRVLHPATLRSGPLLTTELIGEITRGDEVLVLELGLTTDDKGEISGEMDSRTRLRMLVSADTGLLGWMSPETPYGEKLLDPINLLSPEAIALSRGRRSVTSAAGRASPGGRLSQATASPIGSIGAPVDVSATHPPDVESLPWKVGGHYRNFEDQPLLVDVARGSSALLTVTSGTILSVLKMDYQLCPSTGWCPFAKVEVQDGLHRCHQGWVRCISQEGFDLVDTRDQLQFQRMVTQIENERVRRTQILAEQDKEKQEPSAADAVPAPAAAETDSGEESSAGNGESAATSSASSVTKEPSLKAAGDATEPKQAGDAKSSPNRLLALEVGASEDEVNHVDGGVVQEDGWSSCLRCICSRSEVARGDSDIAAPPPATAKAG